MEQPELIPHLFRTEFRKITAVLCKHFSIEHIEAAEDIASDTFLTAFETWPYKGIPENPTAWCTQWQRTKPKIIWRATISSLKNCRPDKRSSEITEEINIDLSEKNITDSQLQMLFAVCHPAISTEAQIGLALRILCGFGAEEIATAFLSNKETITNGFRAPKKNYAAKKWRSISGCCRDQQALENVLTTLYLLFSEGYYSENQDSVLRNELCLEAMRLTYLLIGNEQTNLPPVNALLSLMCFHASRFEARKNENGELVLYHDQDETLWIRS